MIKWILFIVASILIINSLMAQQIWDLEGCIRHAIEGNLELKNKTIEAALKEQDLFMAKREWLPSVGAYTNLYSNFGHSQDVFGRIQRNDNLNSNMGITADIMLYTFGLLKNQIQKSKFEIDAVILEKKLLERVLTIKVIQGFLDMMLKEALMEASDSTVFYSRLLYERTMKTTDVGTTSELELHEAKATLARDNQQLAQAKIDWGRARLNLAQLMLLDDENQLSIIKETEETFNEQLILNEKLLAEAYAKHPGLLRFDTLRHGLEIERRLIQAQRYPMVKGSASIGSTYFNPLKIQNTAGFFQQAKDNFAQQIAITVSIPIYDKGRNRLELKKIDLSKKKLDLEAMQGKLDIRQQIEKIYYDYRNNQKTCEFAKESLMYAEHAMSFAKKSYEAGRSTIYDLNASRNSFVQAKSQWLQAKYSALFSYKMLLFELASDTKLE